MGTWNWAFGRGILEDWIWAFDVWGLFWALTWAFGAFGGLDLGFCVFWGLLLRFLGAFAWAFGGLDLGFLGLGIGLMGGFVLGIWGLWFELLWAFEALGASGGFWGLWLLGDLAWAFGVMGALTWAFRGLDLGLDLGLLCFWGLVLGLLGASVWTFGGF